MSKLWAFWFNKPNKTMPLYIELCLKYMKALNGDKFQLITEKNIFDFLNTNEVPTKLLSEYDVVSKNEYIRTRLLHKYGGVYSDADCIHLEPVYESLHNCMDNTNYNLCSWYGGTAFFIAKQGSAILEKSLEDFENSISEYKSGDVIKYACFGGGTMHKIAVKNNLIDGWRHFPQKNIKLPNSPERPFRIASDPTTNEIIIWTYGCNSYNKYYNEEDKEAFNYILNNNPKMVMLYNRNMQNLKHKNIEDILSRKGLMFDLFRHMENKIK